jgi:hypothetical protein
MKIGSVSKTLEGTALLERALRLKTRWVMSSEWMDRQYRK